MEKNRRRTDPLDRAVLAVGVLVIVVLSLMTVARPAQWTLQLPVPIPTLTKEQRWDRLMDELYEAVDAGDHGEIWRLLGEIDKLLGKQWLPSPVQIDVVCDLCMELASGKDAGVCARCRKHLGR